MIGLDQNIPIRKPYDTPDKGHVYIYVKGDRNLYIMDEGGLENHFIPSSSSTENFVPRVLNGKYSDSALYSTATQVAIGHSSPSASLDILGTFKFASGNQGLGKILISDANGNLDYQNIPVTNGISLISNNIGLGGSLTQNTNISGSDKSLTVSLNDTVNAITSSLSIGTGTEIQTIESLNPLNYSTLQINRFNATSMLALMRVKHATSGGGELQIKGDTIFLANRTNADVDIFKLQFNSSQAIFSDGSVAGSGLQYAADYSSNYSNRSLVDKGWVLTQLSSISIGAEQIDDRVAALMQNNVDTTWNYNDSLNTLEVLVNHKVSINVSAARNGNTTNQYLQEDGLDMNLTPHVLAVESKLLLLSASCASAATWTAEVHVNGVLVPGATLTITAGTSGYTKFLVPITFNPGDKVQLYCSGSGVSRPRINAVFTAYE